MRIHRSESGFTLIEILVAGAILALLTAALVPLVITQVQKGRVGRTQSAARSVAEAFLQYFADTGRWPCNWSGASQINEQLVDYSCLYSNTSSLPHWNGPYLSRGIANGEKLQVAIADDSGAFDGLLDAWGNPFQVVFRKADRTLPGEGGGVILLLSSGPDMKLATTVQNAVAEKPAGDDSVHVVTRKVN